ncbi:MAG: M28 family peptidase [Candidatus Hydrogenedentes bacterium]|nr:M28 family peptidase [Candidatus Hydrogenedentota bacterium]
MNMAQMRRDIEYLAGNLTHRGASTKSERAAAEYLHERLSRYTPDTEIDDFYAIESPWLLFASYYGEFLIIAVLSFWWAWFAFAYGALVFLLYMAEFSGYHLLGRLLPHYETQNVVARVLGQRPERLFIVTAHYDSPKYSAVTSAAAQPWLRVIHVLLVVSMLAVLVCCVIQGLGMFADSHIRPDLVVQWVAVTMLLCGAAALVVCDLSGEFVRGAADNASGVAVLLGLAERLTEDPIPNADVWFVATGSKETWLSGIRQFMNTHTLDKETTYFLNVDRVGAGDLRYVTAEGMLHLFRSPQEMVSAARGEASACGAEPLAWRGLPTDAFLPLARGMNALSITATGGRDLRETEEDDRPGDIDYGTVTKAGEFAEAILRRHS